MINYYDNQCTRVNWTNLFHGIICIAYEFLVETKLDSLLEILVGLILALEHASGIRGLQMNDALLCYAFSNTRYFAVPAAS